VGKAAIVIVTALVLSIIFIMAYFVGVILVIAINQVAAQIGSAAYLFVPLFGVMGGGLAYGAFTYHTVHADRGGPG